MKRILSIILVFVMIMGANQVTFGEEETTSYNKEVTASFSGGTRTVSTVWVNLNNPKMRVETVLAKGDVGDVDTLQNIAASADDEDSTVVAAINGSFFNAYADLQPSGTLQVLGETVHFSNKGSVFGINGSNKFFIEPLFVQIEGSINGSWEWPNNWDAWNFNHLYETTQSSAVFTPAYGEKTPEHDMTSIVVNKHVVTSISKGQANIPVDGFVIVTGIQSQIDQFKVGYTVDYRVKYYENNYDGTHGDAIDWEQMRSGVGAGPTLLLNSEIVVDPVKEGFTELKIVENRATRSFIGITPDNMMVMGVVNNVSMYELAEITKNMGLKDALNLDGGGSSGLLYNNSYLIQPGRQLSNAIVIKKMNKTPIRIFLNNKELFFDAEPYIDSASRTMVPMRKLFEVLGATVSYNNTTRQIVAVKDGITIKLLPGSNIADVDGKAITLDSQVIIKNNRSMMPLRFITEEFGGAVTWHGDANSIDLTVDSVKSEEQIEGLENKAEDALNKGDSESAKALYLQILDNDSKNITALKAMGVICSQEKNYEDSVTYYKRALEIEPDNYDLWGSIGWVYASIPDMDMATEAFNNQISLNPNLVPGYYGLGQVYAHYLIQDTEKAKECFNKALSLNPTDAQREYMENYISTH